MKRRQSYDDRDINNPIELVGGDNDGMFIEQPIKDTINIPLIGFGDRKNSYVRRDDGNYYITDNKE